MMPLDHAELCLCETRENTEVNGACQALLSMTRDSAISCSCRARHEHEIARYPECITHTPLMERNGTMCHVELRQGGVVADEESAPDEWTDLAQGDTQLRETGQFRWLVHGWSRAQCAVSLKVSPRI